MSAQLRALESAIQMAQAALDRRSAPRACQEPAWHAEAEQRYRAGENLREIAKAVGRTYGGVHQVLVARGVPMRKRGGWRMSTEMRREIGRKGGAATRDRYGRQHFARMAQEASRRYWERYERTREEGGDD
jgi:Helix-turn-helix domain